MSRLAHAPENALTKALAARRAAGLPLIDLTESNPTVVGLRLAPAALPEAPSYDPQPRGLLPARQAVAAYHGVAAEQVLLTASTSEAYSYLFKLLCDPGDEVLVPEPSYPLFGWLTALDGVRAVPYPLRFDGEWHLPAEALPFGPRTRAVLVVSPGNPTGAFLKLDERARLAGLCARSGCALISDEVFADFSWAPDPRRMRTAAAFDDVLSFSLSGLSKVAGLPQLKLGWCVAAGPGHEEALQQLELIADTYLGVSTPVQLAAPRLLAERNDFQQQLRARLSENLRALRAACAPGAPWSVLPSEGGWSAILAVPRARSEEEWALLLLERGVLVHPGYFFDFPGGAFLVVSLLPEPAAFARAAAVLHSCLNAR